MIPPSNTTQLISAGAVTSVGLSIATTYAAIIAGLDNFQETHFQHYDGPVIGAPIQYHLHQDLPDPMLRGHERLAAFLRLAIDECVLNSGITSLTNYKIPILLVLGETERFGRTKDLVACCKAVCDTYFHEKDNTHFFQAEIGAVGVIDAIYTANRLLAQKEYPLVLIASIDSWLNVPDIQFAISNDRLLSKENSQGFIPGEAASAILLGNPKLMNEHNLTSTSIPKLQLTGIAKGEELADLKSEAPCYGKGLASAISNALAQAKISLSDLQLEVTSSTSEPYFLEEAAYARARLLRKSMPSEFKRIHPANSVGNVGAAFGPLQLALAWYQATKTISKSPILISLSSTGKARGAIIATHDEIKGN